MSPSRKRVRDLLATGLTPREVAAAMGVSTQAVYGHMKALGIDPPSRRTPKEAA